jgi:hypothetical protein
MRNPKPEIRNPKEGRSPKSEVRSPRYGEATNPSSLASMLAGYKGFRRRRNGPGNDFGFRVSDLFRVSGFGFRISNIKPILSQAGGRR